MRLFKALLTLLPFITISSAKSHLVDGLKCFCRHLPPPPPPLLFAVSQSQQSRERTDQIPSQHLFFSEGFTEKLPARCSKTPCAELSNLENKIPSAFCSHLSPLPGMPSVVCRVNSGSERPFLVISSKPLRKLPFLYSVPVCYCLTSALGSLFSFMF